MSTATPGNARPPVASCPTGEPGAAVRPTALPRPTLPVKTVPMARGIDPADVYVRTYWVAAIGAGAVSELLRLIRAGQDGSEIVIPRWLPVLIRADLVTVVDGTLIVGSKLPPVPVTLQRRFHPGLRDRHRRWDRRGRVRTEG